MRDALLVCETSTRATPRARPRKTSETRKTFLKCVLSCCERNIKKERNTQKIENAYPKLKIFSSATPTMKLIMKPTNYSERM